MDRKKLLEKRDELERYKEDCEANLCLLYTEFGKLFFSCDREIPKGLETQIKTIKNVLEVLKNTDAEIKMICEELEKPIVYICPNCSTQSIPGAKFCHECGARLEEEEKAPEGGKICPNCGNTLKSQTKFCGKCGTSVS